MSSNDNTTNGATMSSEKLSVSLSPALVLFVKEYQEAYHCGSKSEVIQEALKLLRQKELEKEYYAAGKEIDADFDITNMDGLDDETW
jgi:antitoxin ParD1/3/4